MGRWRMGLLEMEIEMGCSRETNVVTDIDSAHLR